MRLFEQSLQAMAELDIDRTKKLAIGRAVTTYTMGHAQRGLTRVHGRATLSDPEWRAYADAYLQRLIDSGDFPHLAGFGTEALLHDENEEQGFDTGLDWLLTGIAAELSTRRARWAQLDAITGQRAQREQRLDAGHAATGDHDIQRRGAHRASTARRSCSATTPSGI
jgi:hypothetical protein